MTAFVRWTKILPIPALLAIAGCSGCEQTPEPPLPIPQEGRLPAAPQPIVTMGTPEIPPPACAVVIASDIDDGAAPFEVRFSAEGMCTDADGEFTWDFGDGSPVVHEANPTHVYQQPGTYTARVSLTDKANNASDADETPVNVLAPEKTP